MQKNKQVNMGRKKFNMDPKKVGDTTCDLVFHEQLLTLSPVPAPSLPQGIQFMIENDLLKNTSDDIAQFLCKGEGLNKTAIGDYLGERSGWMRFLPLTFSVGSCGIHPCG